MNYATRIMANARVKLTGAVDDATKLELFNTIDEFCKETDAWREDIPVTYSTTPDTVYDLVPTLGTPLRLIRFYAVEGEVPGRATMRVPGELVVHSQYQNATPLMAVLSLAPLDPVDSDGFPEVAEWLWQRYWPLFTDGLIYRMAATPDKPYTNPMIAGFHGRKWRNGISVARADQVKANLADGQAWRFPNFARGSQR